MIYYALLFLILVVCLVDARMKQRQLRARAGWVEATEQRAARY